MRDELEHRQEYGTHGIVDDVQALWGGPVCHMAAVVWPMSGQQILVRWPCMNRRDINADDVDEYAENSDNILNKRF